MIRKIIFGLIALYAIAAAGIIDIPDDDRHQIISFEECPGDSFVVGFSTDIDSGFWERTYFPPDTVVPAEVLDYIPPDRDENDRVIPGDYSGQYWIYIDTWENGMLIAGIDTAHVIVSYTIPGGCSAPTAITVDP